ncbi:MAG: phage tail tape measure protein [Treponematales bacterium]
MAKEITAGILLKLKDQFSPKIKGAAGSFTGFGDKAVAAADKINKAFSGVAGTLGTLGVTLGAMSLFKASVDYEDSLIRIGTNAGYTAAQTNEARRELLRIAAAAKISDAEMKAFAATLGDNSLGYEDMMQSAEFAAQAIQGLGLGGEEVGEMFSMLLNRGASVDEVKQKLNNLAGIDDRMPGMSLSNFTAALPQLMEESGKGVESIEELYKSVLTLNRGTTNRKAISSYTEALRDLKNIGVKKSFEELAFKSESYLKSLGLSGTTIHTLKMFSANYQEVVNKVGELGDTSDAISRQAEANARSLKSALTGLKSAVMAQSDSALVYPIEKLAEPLNKHPDGLEKTIKGVGAALAGLAGIRLAAGVVSFLANLRGLRRGGPIVPQIGGLGGGASPLPVFVTNMRGGRDGNWNRRRETARRRRSRRGCVRRSCGGSQTDRSSLSWRRGKGGEFYEGRANDGRRDSRCHCRYISRGYVSEKQSD